MSIIHSAAARAITLRGILHVGACALEEAEEYAAASLPVIWVEAQRTDPSRVARAEKFGHILYEGTPLSDCTEKVVLNIANNNGGSSSLLAFKEHAKQFPEITYTGVRVPLIAQRADVVFKRLDPWFDSLVLDVQGYELRVLKGFGALLDQIRQIWVEANLIELYEGCVLWPELLDWLTKAGFPNHDFYMHPSNVWGDAFFWKQ